MINEYKYKRERIYCPNSVRLVSFSLSFFLSFGDLAFWGSARALIFDHSFKFRGVTIKSPCIHTQKPKNFIGLLYLNFLSKMLKFLMKHIFLDLCYSFWPNKKKLSQKWKSYFDEKMFFFSHFRQKFMRTLESNHLLYKFVNLTT